MAAICLGLNVLNSINGASSKPFMRVKNGVIFFR